MAEYINRDSLVSQLEECLSLKPNIAFILNHIIDILKGYPTADVVEVVRCKDCKHYKLRNQSVRWSPTKPCCTRKANVKVGENDFCSYGERKGGAENG